jgi:hypothetical protein
MNIRAFLTIAGVLAALVQPAAAGADNPLRAGTAHGGGASATKASVAKQNSKPVVTRSAVTKRASRTILIYTPASTVTTAVDQGVGDVNNCASYTGCTDDEYCIIWFLRCELVPPPVGSLQLHEGRLS